MKRKSLVRFELLLLAVVTLLLAYRVMEGPPSPSGLVVLDDLERNEVYRESFAVTEPTRVAIDAVGSYESEDPDAQLAAYGWLLRRENREVVWRMDPQTVTRRDKTVATRRDTVTLSPGTYDVYFASLGNTREGGFNFLFLDRLFGRDATWRDDGRDWHFILSGVDGPDRAFSKIDTKSDVELGPSRPDMLWSTAPMRGNSREELVFLTAERVPVRIYAVGEIDNERMDYGWIEDAIHQDRIWEMTRENTEPAGGWHVNRLFADTLLLDAGIYRAVFETDPRQHFDDWLVNPPFDPAAWGMSLFSPAKDAVQAFDPWASREPIVQISQVGDHERHSAQLQVNKPLPVAVYAVGEMSSGDKYDYAWIRNNDSQERIWEMEYERTTPAGGHNNRAELALLELPEGTYTVVYQTDDSHSFASWRHGSPDHPERWGVSIFPVDAQLDTSAVRVLAYSEEPLGDEEDEEAAEAPGAPPLPDLPPLPGTEIIDLSAIGNEQTVSERFMLEQPTTIHIRALGEVSLSGRYDYGWIERPETGEIVWEMNWQNTRPAGGDDVNRYFDGPLQLEPGTYVVHYRTDFSHAFGDFNGRAPQQPQAWGIRISK